MMRRQVTRTAILGTVLALGFISSAAAQAPTEFEKIGVQLHRDYLRLQPFERLDTHTGNVILTIPMLSVPGNAGRPLVFQLTYNANVRTVGQPAWLLGIAGVPMRVDEQATGDPYPDHPTTIATTWGITPKIIMADGGTRRTMFMSDPRTSTRMSITSNFWKYDRDTNWLYMPDGTQYRYSDSSDGRIKGRLEEILDVYGNRVILTWAVPPQGDHPSALEVIQVLGTSESRGIDFVFNTAGLPETMEFDNRMWQYHYDERPEELTRTTPPAGPPGWTFSYGVPIEPVRRLTSLTTPHGGQIDYEYTPHWLSATDYEVLLDWRRTTDRGHTTTDDWHIEYDPTGQGYSADTTITTPTRRVTYEYGSVQTPSTELLIDGGIALLSTTVEGNVSGTWTEMESEEREYTQIPTVWWSDGETHFDESVPSQRIITRDGQTYTTTLTYGPSGPTSTFGDYHQPNGISEEGELSRTIGRNYFHGATAYVRGQIAGETVISDGESWTRSWNYDSATGFVTQQTEFGTSAPAAIATTFERDDYGNVHTATSATSKTTTFTYSWGVVEDTQTPEYTVTRSIRPDGTVASESRGPYTTTYPEWDAYYDGYRVERTQPAGGPSVSVPIDVDYGDGTTVQTKRGSTVIETVTLDGFGRPIQTVTHGSPDVITTTAYDPEGRVTYEGYPHFGTNELGVEVAYDALHRVTSRTNPGGSRSTFSYLQGLVTITDEEGRNTYQTWDAFGDPDRARLMSVRNHLNQTWVYTYHGLGQLKTVAAPGSTTRTWLYNAQNRLQSETHPESGTTTYSVYDDAGVLKQKADENGNQFVYQHDDNSRVTRITAGTRITNIGYELGTDNRVSMSNGSVSTTFEYDQAGRLNHRRDIIGAYAFDTRYTYYPENDQVKTITYPTNRVVEYERNDPQGRITKVFESQSVPARDYAFGMSYHPSGGLATYTANGTAPMTTTIAYVPQRYWVQSITAGAMQLTYGNYDLVGNVGTITDGRGGSWNQTFTYDELHRLKTADGPYGSAAYSYDAHGNRQTDLNSTYTYDPVTLRLSTQNGQPFGYDDNGNLTSEVGKTYTYTPENWLATVNGTQAAYLYDADGLRAKKVVAGDTTLYVHGLGGELLTEWHNLGATARARDYVYAGSRLIAAIDKTLGFTTCGGQAMPDGLPNPMTITSGSTGSFTFEGSACRRVSVVITSGTMTPNCLGNLRILHPDGTWLANTGGACADTILEPVQLPVSGTFTVVEDPYQTNAGTISVNAYDVVDVTGPITLGQAANAPLHTPGQRALWTFTGAANQRVSAVVTSAAMSNCLGSLAILKPDGSQLAQVGGASCAGAMIEPVALPTAGVYTVVADPYKAITGDLAVTTYDVVDHTGSIAVNGSAVTGPLTTPGQKGEWSFEGTNGQQVRGIIDASSVPSCAYGAHKFRIVKPDGNTLISKNGICAGTTVGPVTLPSAGTYKLVVDPATNYTGTVTVRLVSP